MGPADIQLPLLGHLCHRGLRKPPGLSGRGQERPHEKCHQPVYCQPGCQCPAGQVSILFYFININLCIGYFKCSLNKTSKNHFKKVQPNDVFQTFC